MAGSEEFSEKGLVLSGAAADGAAEGAAGAGEFVEKGMVLSGSGQQAAPRAVVAGVAGGTGAQAGGGWRGAGLGRSLRALFSEKSQVLSGAPPAAVAGGAGIAEKSRVLSGSAGVAGAVPLEAPQGGLGAATSLLAGRQGWGSGALRVG
jgi:hypothetical protein